jgi:DNA polymerase-3 subunit epsilon
MGLLDRLVERLGLVRGSDLSPTSRVADDARPATSVAATASAPDFVVIDVETACSRVSSICQIGIVGFADGREVLAYETLVDPQDIFESFNTRLHGIGPHHVRGKPTFAKLRQTLVGHLGGRVTVAHSNFDRSALGAACAVARQPEIETRWLDSVRVARHAWPDLSSHKLNVLARHLGVAHRHHDALSDARAAGWVIVKAMEHTGIDLEGWMAGPWRRPTRHGRPPEMLAMAAEGPLAGARVAIMGQPRDGDLAMRVAAAP